MEIITCLKINNKLVDFLGISSVTWTIEDSIDFRVMYSYIKYEGEEYLFKYFAGIDDKPMFDKYEDGDKAFGKKINKYYEDNPNEVYYKYNISSKSLIICQGEEIETVVEYKSVSTDVDTEGMIEALKDTLITNVKKYNENIMLERYKYLLTLPNLTIGE